MSNCNLTLAQPGGIAPANILVPDLFVSTNLFDKESEMTYKINGENVKGSLFLDTGWVSGSIILKDNRTFNNQKIRYNIYQQVVSFFVNNQSLDITDDIKEFTLLYGSYTKKRFVNASNYKSLKTTQYFEVLLESKKACY